MRRNTQRCCELFCTCCYGLVLVLGGGTSLLAAYAAAFDTGESGVLPPIYPQGPRWVAEMVQNDAVATQAPAKPGLFDDVRRANYEPVARACSFAAANTVTMAYGHVEAALSEWRPLRKALYTIGRNIECHALTTDPSLRQGPFVAQCSAMSGAPSAPPSTPWTTELDTLRMIGENNTSYDCTATQPSTAWRDDQMALSRYERSLLLMAPLVRALVSPSVNSGCDKLKEKLADRASKLQPSTEKHYVQAALGFLYDRAFKETHPLTSAEWPFIEVSGDGLWSTGSEQREWSGPQRTAYGNSTFEPRITTTAVLIASILSSPDFYEELNLNGDAISACLTRSSPSSSCRLAAEGAADVAKDDDICTSIYGLQQPPDSYTAADYLAEQYPVKRVVSTDTLGGGLFTSLRSEGQRQPPVRVPQAVCRRDDAPSKAFADPYPSPPPSPPPPQDAQNAQTRAYKMGTTADVMRNMRAVCDAVHTWGIYDRDHTFGIPDPTHPREILYPEEVVELQDDETGTKFAWAYKSALASSVYLFVERNPYESWYEPLVAGQQASSDPACDRAKRSLAYVWYVWGIGITAATPAVVTAGFFILYGLGMLLAVSINLLHLAATSCLRLRRWRIKEDTIPYLPEQNLTLVIMAIGVITTWILCEVAESTLSGKHTRYLRPRCSFDGGLWIPSERYADIFSIGNVNGIPWPLMLCLITGFGVRVFRLFLKRAGAVMVPASKQTRPLASLILLAIVVVWQTVVILNRSNILIQSTQRVAKARLSSSKMCESPYSQHAQSATFCDGLRGGQSSSSDFDNLVKYVHSLFVLAWYAGATVGVLSSSWAFFIPQINAAATTTSVAGIVSKACFAFCRPDRLAYAVLVIFTCVAYLYAAIVLTKPFSCEATDVDCIAERDDEMVGWDWLTWPGIVLLVSTVTVTVLWPAFQRCMTRAKVEDSSAQQPGQPPGAPQDSGMGVEEPTIRSTEPTPDDARKARYAARLARARQKNRGGGATGAANRVFEGVPDPFGTIRDSLIRSTDGMAAPPELVPLLSLPLPP